MYKSQFRKKTGFVVQGHIYYYIIYYYFELAFKLCFY